ncbi:hypothetical protein VT03_31140 [Planctomyces sp. SH-PL14]|nr:hypothetical protein VT03_31140 [Planctomyces sp. SH-PL14]
MAEGRFFVPAASLLGGTAEWHCTSKQEHWHPAELAGCTGQSLVRP